MPPTSPLDAFKADYLARVAAKIDARIAHLKELIASLHEALKASPELRPAVAEELQALIGEPVVAANRRTGLESTGERPEAPSNGGENGPHLRTRIAEFFRHRNNEAASIERIFQAVGGAESSVRGMLYKKNRNNGWFVRVEVQGEPDHWKLAEEKFGEPENTVRGDRESNAG